jgi:hypothetical protein
MAQKRKYFGEFFPAQMPEGASGRMFLEFFQTDKETGRPKGICGVESPGCKVVIKNERQHRITKANAEKFRATLKELAATPRPKNVHPKLWEAQKAGLKSQLQDLVAELHEYETLKTGGPKILAPFNRAASSRESYACPSV